MKAGDPVIAADVIAGGRRAARPRSASRASPSAKIGEQQIEVNHQTHLATLVLPVDPGPGRAVRQRSGSAASRRSARAMSRRSPGSSAGEPFKRSKVDDLRRALIATRPGRRTPTSRSCRSNGGRTVDLAVRLEPAPSHTIAGELGYGTGQGARARSELDRPQFLQSRRRADPARGRRHQRAARRASSSAAATSCSATRCSTCRPRPAHQKFDAYEAKTIQLAGNIERQSNFIWQKKWTWTYGGELLATDERGVFEHVRASRTRARS